jgi:hypothetical protein
MKIIQEIHQEAKMSVKHIKICLACFFYLFIYLLPSTALAQLYSSSITGVIRDPSGAVVPGAIVTLTDSGKGFTYSSETDSVGRYVLRSLPPSSYKLKVEMQGFNTYVQEGIVLDVNQNATIDVSLKLGAETQTVEVLGAAPVLATEDAVTGQAVNRTFLNDLPLVGRSVFDLAKLTPGVTQVSGGYVGGSMGNNFISNGGRNATADILMDGVSATGAELNASITQPIYVPSVDAVQEFKVQQNNFSAEIGFSGATIINLLTRSGTNAFHGSAWEFLRNNVLTAGDWFSNASGTKLAARRYNLFGATVGGPIKKDKTFFFFDYEGLRDTAAKTFRAGVPSAAMRNGDFGEMCGAGFDGSGMCLDSEGQLWDPYSGVYDSNEGGPVRSRFVPFNNLGTYQSPGNPKLDGTGYQLPATPGNLIDPVASKMIQAFPLPNLDVGTARYNRFNNWIGTGSDNTATNQWDLKIDHSFSANDRLSAKFSRKSNVWRFGNSFGDILDPNDIGPCESASHLFALNHNHTFSPTTLLTVSYGFARSFGFQCNGILADYPDYDPIKELGLPAYTLRSGVPYTPAIYISNYAAASPLNNIGAQPWGVLKEAQETHHILASLSRMQGRHELKFGGEWRARRNNLAFPGTPAGVYSYEFNSTSQYPWSGGGDAMASFLTGVGVPGGWGEYDIDAFTATLGFQYAGFLQDNWRVTDKLTLNLGLRYDLTTPRTERYDRNSYLDLTVPSPLQVPGLPNLRGGVRFTDSNQRHNYGSDHNDFGPRFGLAYRLTDQTVLRGGYGVFYTTTKRSASGIGFEGFRKANNWITSYQNDGATPWGRLSDPFPITGPDFPPGRSLGLLTFVGDSAYGPVRDVGSLNTTPNEQTWSFGIQRQLPGDMLVDANYVGKKGTHLYYGGAGDLNFLGPEIGSYSSDQIAALQAFVPNPFYGIITQGALSGPEIQAYRLQLPFPQFAGFQMDDPPWANSIYHAFQLRVEKRFSRGLQFLVTYTNSKSIDDASVTSGGTTWLGGRTSLQDPNNRKLERSLSQFDIPQVLQFSYVYELPVGRGKAIGGNWNPWLSGIVGGWKTSGQWRFSSGQPIALTLSGGQSLPTYGSQRPSLTGTLERNTGPNFLDQYFANPKVAVAPEPYALGTASRTLPNLRSPGINLANLALFKEISLGRLREGTRLEYRVEAFNAFNRPHFCGPNDTVNGGSFGQITSMCTPPREIQMALKFYW